MCVFTENEFIRRYILARVNESSKVGVDYFTVHRANSSLVNLNILNRFARFRAKTCKPFHFKILALAYSCMLSGSSQSNASRFRSYTYVMCHFENLIKP